MLDQAARLREIAEQYCERPRAAKPYVITIASGKGGVGKSTVALNLALRFAEAGKKTVLLDADENLGNIDVMLGIAPQWRLGSVLRGERDIEDILVSPCPFLQVLPGSSGDPGYPAVTTERQKQLLDEIKDVCADAEYIIIDAAAGIGSNVVGYAVNSHELIIVTVPEPTAVMDAYALIKTVTFADSLLPVKLIVNGVNLPAEGEDTAAKLQKAVRHFLQRPVHYLGAVPFDRAVSKAVLRQRPLTHEFPASAAALSLGSIANRMMQQIAQRGIRRYQTA